VFDQIYGDKHNVTTAHYGNNEVGQRRENQQDRIAQGIRSGQLRPGETARLEGQQQSINHAGMRQANGGSLTGADRAAITSGRTMHPRTSTRRSTTRRTCVRKPD
jgi:hypothetical protein